MEWVPVSMAAALCWGLGQPLVHRSEEPPEISFLRYLALALPPLIAIGLALGGSLRAALSPVPFAVGAMFAASWFYYFEVLRMERVTLTGTVIAAYPTLVLLLSWLFLDQRIEAWGAAGVILVSTGTAGLAWSKGTPGRAAAARWLPAAVFEALLTAATVIALKYLIDKHGSPTSMLALGCFPFVPLAAWRLGRRGPSPPRARLVLPVAGAAMIAGGTLLGLTALRLGHAPLVVAVSGSYPLISALVAFLLLRERVNHVQALSLVVLLVGLGLVILPS